MKARMINSRSNIEHKKERALHALAAKLDQTVDKAEKCGRLTRMRKAFMLEAEKLRERMFRLESDRDQLDVTMFMHGIN